jgi:hypothetical protein
MTVNIGLNGPTTPPIAFAAACIPLAISVDARI